MPASLHAHQDIHVKCRPKLMMPFVVHKVNFFLKLFFVILWNIYIQKTEESVCNLPKSEGQFTQSHTVFVRWYYNKNKSNCEKFLYYGNAGNGNNFLSQVECQRSCRKFYMSSCWLLILKFIDPRNLWNIKPYKKSFICWHESMSFRKTVSRQTGPYNSLFKWRFRKYMPSHVRCTIF